MSVSGSRSSITPSVRLWLGDVVPLLVVTHWRGQDLTGRTFYAR